MLDLTIYSEFSMERERGSILIFTGLEALLNEILTNILYCRNDIDINTGVKFRLIINYLD